MALTIVGLGPGPADMLSLEAQSRLMNAQEVFLRTRRHPTVAHLPAHLTVHSFDHLYETLPTFEAVYEAIVQRVQELAQRPQGVLYAVPGHPLMAEATVSRLLEQCRRAGTEVEVVAGISFVEPVLEALRLDPFTPPLADGQGPLAGSPTGLQLVDALQPALDPARPALVAQVYSQAIASRLKVELLELYPPEHEVVLVSAAGTKDAQRVRRLRLFELDRGQDTDHLTCLYLPPLSLTENLATFDGLAAIVAHLRAPNGCPWDRAQTHVSLKSYLIEEAYEALEALDRNDMATLREELGDLLLNILLHCQIASEAGEFETRDVLRGIAEKLLRRHPHVFGDLKVATAEEVMGNWETLKSRERAKEISMLDGLPASLPALAYTRSLQERIAPLRLPVEDSLTAGARRLYERLSGPAPAEGLEPLGAALLTLAFQAAAAGHDPEEALRGANTRLNQRIKRLEVLARKRNSSILELDPAARDELWAQVEHSVSDDA